MGRTKIRKLKVTVIIIEIVCLFALAICAVIVTGTVVKRHNQEEAEKAAELTAEEAERQAELEKMKQEKELKKWNLLLVNPWKAMPDDFTVKTAEVENGYEMDEEELGDKMEDVIFHGTVTRKQMGFAKVALTIDNTDRALHVDSDEVRTSNYAIAKMLDEMGYISDYEHPDKLRGSVNEPCYTIRGNSRLRCQSKIKWCRYQIDFRKTPNSDELEWGITCATRSTSSERFHNGPCDVTATKQMADRVGVQPYYKDLGGLK